MMRLDDITARGYASYFRRFSNFNDEEIRFVLCALLQPCANSQPKISLTAAHSFSFTHVTESEHDIQNARQLSQICSIHKQKLSGHRDSEISRSYGYATSPTNCTFILPHKHHAQKNTPPLQ